MIHSFKYAKEKIGQVGEVIKTSRSLAQVTDLSGAVLGEGVSFENGEHGMVSRLDKDSAEVMVFSQLPVPIGEKVARTGEMLKISVGEGMLGDTFDALGHISGGEKDPSTHTANMPLESTAPGIDQRAEITQFLSTGTTVVDLVMPLGQGQRELVLGDQKTGKTHFVLQTVIAQAKLGVVCVLGLIGKEKSEIKRIEQLLESTGVRDKCIIIAEPARSTASRLTMVPFTAMTVAEYWKGQGQDSLVILDDLSHHAVRYREMKLLGDAFPGRDSYPNDIFYLHARLLERAGNFMVKDKPVSITCLPVLSTVDGDISGYIETNIMSMTDGHLFFDQNLFFDGVRPAVNVFLSVTRVGRQTQTKLAKQVSQTILTIMTEYGELKRFLRFGAELTDKVKESIRLAHGVREMFKQTGKVSILPDVQIYLVGYLWSGKWDGMQAEELASKIQDSKELLKQVSNVVKDSKDFSSLVTTIKKQKKIS
jgi:F-type H+/Na+-transporting ATPase subunit alpha